MQAPIKCRILVGDFPKDWSMTPEAWETWVVGKLKDAGIPIVGFLRFDALSSGVLVRFDDPLDFGAAVYEWTPGSAAEEEHRVT